MKKRYIVSFVSAAAILTGCGGTTEEKASAIFEKTAEAEESFVKQQSSLAKLEKTEQEIYQEMMTANKEDKEKWRKLGKEADENLKERAEKLSAEQEAMKKAAEEFSKMHALSEQMEDKKAKKQLSDLIKTMEARYKEHQTIDKLYKELLQLNKELYGLLEKEETTLAQVEEQLAKINERNEKLTMAVKRFNELTNTFNKQKALFDKSMKKE
ncbi:YkyA family protein [Bacillus aerolatus]|uniref:YkyA family protein n=1 Tax=Bacillus aerolatus TaxID=2653354 RepID=UPI00177B5E74|nr:YkyA family protein [Bacillus aerolatus]